jgi:hypothetical protein
LWWRFNYDRRVASCGGRARSRACGRKPDANANADPDADANADAHANANANANANNLADRRSCLWLICRSLLRHLRCASGFALGPLT